MKHIFTQKNNREIPNEDKIFGINLRANQYLEKNGSDRTINATVGALLDDSSELIVMDSVRRIFEGLTPEMYAPYASIDGDIEYQMAVKKAVFGNINPELEVGVVATPGGTGAIKNMVVNYTKPGDKILTTDWYWATYNTICVEHLRELDTFETFDENRKFHIASLKESLEHIALQQENLALIINTPAHNPTGYSLSSDDWDALIDSLNEISNKVSSICLFIDIAYIDFAGDEDDVRMFFSKLKNLNENIISTVGYSGSKTYTLYGLRVGAILALHKNQEIIDEFKIACKFSSRNSWSNSPKVGHEIIKKIYSSNELLSSVNFERKKYRDMLLKRGAVFEEEAKKIGLTTVPFNGGFFISIPCENSQVVADELEKEGIFIVPLRKGLRISIASISEAVCKRLPGLIVPHIVK